jgi:hypothetical protein
MFVDKQYDFPASSDTTNINQNLFVGFDLRVHFRADGVWHYYMKSVGPADRHDHGYDGRYLLDQGPFGRSLKELT